MAGQDVVYANLARSVGTADPVYREGHGEDRPYPRTLNALRVIDEVVPPTKKTSAATIAN